MNQMSSCEHCLNAPCLLHSVPFTPHPVGSDSRDVVQWSQAMHVIVNSLTDALRESKGLR